MEKELTENENNASVEEEENQILIQKICELQRKAECLKEKEDKTVVKHAYLRKITYDNDWGFGDDTVCLSGSGFSITIPHDEYEQKLEHNIKIGYLIHITIYKE